jgi:hypothetical protein
MKGMLKLWRQDVLIQQTGYRRKSLIQIIEDWQESNRFVCSDCSPDAITSPYSISYTFNHPNSC